MALQQAQTLEEESTEVSLVLAQSQHWWVWQAVLPQEHVIECDVQGHSGWPLLVEKGPGDSQHPLWTSLSHVAWHPPPLPQSPWTPLWSHTRPLLLSSLQHQCCTWRGCRGSRVKPAIARSPVRGGDGTCAGTLQGVWSGVRPHCPDTKPIPKIFPVLKTHTHTHTHQNMHL